jgi:hypothetical protein
MRSSLKDISKASLKKFNEVSKEEWIKGDPA